MIQVLAWLFGLVAGIAVFVLVVRIIDRAEAVDQDEVTFRQPAAREKEDWDDS